MGLLKKSLNKMCKKKRDMVQWERATKGKVMQGINSYTPQLFTYINIEELIPKNHILRKINKIFDLTFVRELTADYYCHSNGRPSVDPELFFRMILIGYIQGIRHDRRLCEEIRCNIAYRWYCKLNLDDKVPDHSSLSNIRDRYGEEVFEKFFNKVVEKCREYGLVKGEIVMTDSTLIDADASLESIVAKDTEKAKTENLIKNERKPTDSMPKIKITNDTHVSKTDPDSSLAKKNNKGKGLKYKSHTTIDADSRVIIDCNISTGSCHDTKEYLERIAYIQNKYGFIIKEAIADRGYGAIDNIKSLNENNIITYIPLFSNRSGKVASIEEEGFIFYQDEDKYICPNGKELLPKKRSNSKVCKSKSEDCKECSITKDCTASVRKCSEYIRHIYRSDDQVYYEKEQQRMKEVIFSKKLRERMWKIEGIFAEAKNSHGLSRAKYRGISKMQIQNYMTGAVQNLKRLIGGRSYELAVFLSDLRMQKVWINFYKRVIIGNIEISLNSL